MKKLIVANWKMNPTSFKEARNLLLGIKKLKNEKIAEVVICPPFVFIRELKSLGAGLKIGAQNCFFEEKGAFTGEVSLLMLKEAGVEYIISGHSERRKYFGETDELINKKVKALLKNGLKPILCVGETEKERKMGVAKEVIKRQLFKGLEKIDDWKLRIKNLSVAYEPVWAIGTGNPCLPKDAKEIFIFIKKLLEEKFGKETAKKIRIIYGGSVNGENAKGYIKESGMQGLLVGGASLDQKEFIKIVKNIR